MSDNKRYNTGKYESWRDKVLKRAGYLCEECKRYGRRDAKGLPVAAVVAHHIKHADEYPESFFDVKNGRALCAACHNKAHPEKGNSWKNGGRFKSKYTQKS